MLEVIILGCGSSMGVPVIGCECEVCSSDLIYNKRSRCAIIIKNKVNTILVDFGYEIREQLIRAKIKTLDAAILTHDHADHVSGIDNLRAFSYIQKKPLEILTDEKTANTIINRYKYLFESEIYDAKSLIAKVIKFQSKVTIGSIEVQFFRQYHGPKMDSLGIKIGDFAYTNDVSTFPIESEEFLFDLKIWILDCKSQHSSKFHIGMEQVLILNEKYKPQKLYLTNMSHNIDYNKIKIGLPPNVIPLYDGMIIKL